MISNGQFKELAKRVRSHEGFSINVHTGAEPTEGFMVGGLAQPQQRPAPTTHGGHLRQYAVDNAAVLRGADRYLGAWAPNYVATIEPSQNIKPKADVAAEYGAGVARADARTSTMDAMIGRNEMAAYDLDKVNPDGTKGADLPNPHYDPNRKQGPAQYK